MESRLELVAQVSKANTHLFRKALDGLSREQLLARPEQISNPMIWIAGHMTMNRGSLASLLGNKWQEPWAGLFRRGGLSKDDSRFPQSEEIVEKWNEVSGLLARSFENATPEFLDRVMPQGSSSFDGKAGGTVALLTFHESYHMGQLAYLRKWLGLGQFVG